MSSPSTVSLTTTTTCTSSSRPSSHRASVSTTDVTVALVLQVAAMSSPSTVSLTTTTTCTSSSRPSSRRASVSTTDVTVALVLQVAAMSSPSTVSLTTTTTCTSSSRPSSRRASVSTTDVTVALVLQVAAMSSPSTVSLTTTTTCTSSSRPSSRRASVSTTDDTSDCVEPYFQLSPAPATPQPQYNFSRSPSQSVKRKPRKKCKDLSHYNSVPPIGHMSRSNSNSFSPSLSLISPTESGPKSPRSYQAPRSPQEHSPRIGNRSPSEPKSPRKSPLTPTSNHFNFPPSPSYTTKSPGTSKRKFSFSGPKSPKSPSTESATVDGETVATSLSRPSSPRGLAYLASRRGSRESNISNVSNEELAPLNFTNTARGRQRRTSNFLELPVPDHIRPRVCSLPEKPYNPRSGDELYRLRTFSITNKGVVNYGDSIINRRSRSNTSVNSTASRHSNHSGISNNSPWEGSCCGSSYNNVSTETSGEEVAKYRVVLLGDSGVGKTALVSQFMTSEYMNTYDASLDDEFGEKTVSVLLDGEESEMVFIDHPNVEMSVENSLSTYEPHACVVVYSIVNRASFKVAEEILNYLWRESYTKDKSVIVVGNKADLARSRVITANEGKALAASRDCKFIETSSGIQHNVDELLVGILKQIRLRETRDKKKARRGVKRLHGSKTSLSLNIAREILHKMCLTDGKSKSCENLHVL